MSKFEIITLVIIIIIICIILYSCQETFINNSVNLRLEYDFYGHKYFSNVTNELDHNIYFLANKKYGDNKNLYLMNHSKNIVIRPIPPPGYEPPQDASEDDYSMSDDEIYNLAFLVKIVGNNNNYMSFFKITNVANIDDDTERVELGGETFGLQRDALDLLQNVYFIRNEVGDPSKGFKIVKNDGSGNKYLEIDYGSGYSFKEGYQIKEKYKHTFYLIPFFCVSISNTGAELHEQGAFCLWHKRI